MTRHQATGSASVFGSASGLKWGSCQLLMKSCALRLSLPSVDN